MASPTYRFGDFHLDPVRRELRRGDAELALPFKVFACVVFLIEKRDRAVGRDELIAAVWGHVHLTDSVLGQAIRQARQALGDSGEEQRTIRTVRGFGYRWVAPVDVTVAEGPAIATPAPTEPQSRKPMPRRGQISMAVLLGALILTALALRTGRDATTNAPESPVSNAAVGGAEIALLLPVDGTSKPADTWIRLGLMDFIAGRLRAAGQPMVPSDTVIAMMHGRSDASGPEQLLRLSATTRAHLVLDAQAQQTGNAWRVSLRSLAGREPPLNVTGEASDVLAAARIAADRLALALGHTPPSDPGREPNLDLLVQRITAAMLAERPDAARQLIADAPAALRASPEIRFQQGRIHFYSHELADAEASFASLLAETPADRDPLLRARVLNGLAAVRVGQGDRTAAEPLLKKAARLLKARDAPDTLGSLGTVLMNLGNLAQEHGQFELARTRFAQARRIFEGSGDVRSLASLDSNVGVLETRRERYAEAVHLFESAAERHAAVRNVGGELTALCYVVQARLLLLEPLAASALEARIRDLLTRTDNPELIARAKVFLLELLERIGRHQASSVLLDELLASTAARVDLDLYRRDALVQGAMYAAQRADFVVAAELTGKVVAELATDSGNLQAETRARAWLILIRATLASGDLATAAQASTAMSGWAERVPGGSPRILATLAAAELAVAEGRPEAAQDRFERALVLADASRVPLRLLQVVESYVPWLLGGGTDGVVDADRALLVAERVSGYADRDYAAALVQLRVYRVLGPVTAWRNAFAHARALAGERRIPANLQPAA